MNLFEVMLVVVAVLSLITFQFLFTMYKDLSRMHTYAKQTQEMQVGILTHLRGIETVLGKVVAGFTEMVATSEDLMDSIRVDSMLAGPKVYQTTDGKYVAKSMNELLDKIKQDNQETKYFSEEEIHNLKKMFSEDETTFFDDSDEDDDDDEVNKGDNSK
jgi:hypothetical protein